MPDDDLIPLKQVAGALGVSRPTLWRARKAVRGFPLPVIIRGRVFWRQGDIPALQDATSRFDGRLNFETERRRAKLVAQKEAAKRRRVKSQKAPKGVREPDLFD